MGHTVGDVARLARVSVRALHHYDEIGLLKPSGRSKSGYRLYTEADLEKLQQVLVFRELGFALDDIARIVRDPSFDRRKALVAQRSLLVEKRQRLESMVALVDKTLDALEKGTSMETGEMFDGDFDPKLHEEEAEKRWGNTAAFAESKRRTGRYTKEDWKEIRAEQEAIIEAFAQAFEAGVAPSDERAMDVAERARLFIDRRFYPCSHAMHVNLGQMYVSDPRFTQVYEKSKPGGAAFVLAAIEANAARAKQG